MGLVIQTYPGQDGLTRKARIKTATSVFDRPIHKLCLIGPLQLGSRDPNSPQNILYYGL